jgi:Domain of unknown function (DUF1835)
MHLVNGNSAADLLRKVLRLPDVVALLDPLSVGPVYEGPGSLSSWFHQRLAFWEEVSGVSHGAVAELDARLSEVLLAPEITLWIGAGVDDQLLAAWLFSHLARAARAPRVRVVDFGTVRGGRLGTRLNVKVGLLSDEELASHPEPTELTPERVGEFRALWSAWTSSEPTELLALAQMPSVSPTLGGVVGALLDRYPAQLTGLGRWDEALLRNIASHGPKLTRAIGETLGEAFDTLDLIGDLWLFWRVRRLAARSPSAPLLLLSSSSLQMREVEAVLTPHGVAVLGGQANAVDEIGVDDWVGGVHLGSAGGRVWLRTAEGLAPWTRARGGAR